MGVVRVPYLLAELKERGCADESALAKVMQPGCRIEGEDLRKLAAKLGVEVSELAPADAMLLEKTLYQVIARAKYMLGKIDGKFVRPEQAIEFREQLAPGIFKPGYRGFRFKEAAAGDLPTVMIDGRKFNCIASIARAHGLDPVTVRRRIADTGKDADKLTNDEWKLILAKKKGKGKPFTYLDRTYSNIAQFCREHQLNTNLVYQKVKDRADSADEEFWGLIIETCKRKI